MDRSTQSSLGKSDVAAFDFDGTLTVGSSLFPFARRLGNRRRLLRAAAHAAPTAGFPPSRERFKEQALGFLLRDRPIADVQQIGRSFASDVLARQLNPEMVDRARAHSAAHAELVLVTAALDVYVRPVAEALDFDAVIATEVDVVDGMCTGKLRHEGLYGPRKVELLKEWLGDREGRVRLFAYGNSKDDRELLEYATVGLAVDGDPEVSGRGTAR